MLVTINGLVPVAILEINTVDVITPVELMLPVFTLPVTDNAPVD